MTFITDDKLEDLINMRNEGLLCVEVARDKGDDHGLAKWQNCIGRIEAMLARSRTGDLT